MGAQDANFLPSSVLRIWPVTSQDATSIPTNTQSSQSYAISSLTHTQKKFTGSGPSSSACSSSPLPLGSLCPCPLHSDELQAGNKVRKQTKGILGSTSPKRKLGGLVKKELREFGSVRRSSDLSMASFVHSGSGTSDWYENGVLKVIMC